MYKGVGELVEGEAKSRQRLAVWKYGNKSRVSAMASDRRVGHPSASLIIKLSSQQ